jgi:hypothetical protein
MVDEYEDDPSIADDDVLWRRVPLHPSWVVFDETQGRLRPSSSAFDNHRDGTPMSAYLAAGGNTVEEVLEGHPNYSLAGFSAGLARLQGQGIVRRPMPAFPSHVEVFGPKSKSVRSALAKGCHWVVAPPPDFQP